MTTDELVYTTIMLLDKSLFYSTQTNTQKGLFQPLAEAHTINIHEEEIAGA